MRTWWEGMGVSVWGCPYGDDRVCAYREMGDIVRIVKINFRNKMWVLIGCRDVTWRNALATVSGFIDSQ